MVYKIKFHFHLKNSVLQKLNSKILEFIVFLDLLGVGKLLLPRAPIAPSISVIIAPRPHRTACLPLQTVSSVRTENLIVLFATGFESRGCTTAPGTQKILLNK